MAEKPTTLIHSKMVKIMRAVEPIAKARRNEQQGYSFRGIDDVMNAFAPILAEYGVTPRVKGIETVSENEVVSNSGTRGWRTVKRLTIAFTDEYGDSVDVVSDGEAIDYGDKGSNKAMSVAYREAFFKTFCVPFGNDDIENHDHDLKASKQLEKDVQEVFQPSNVDVKKLECNVCKETPVISNRTGKPYCPNWKDHPKNRLVAAQEINLNNVPF